MSIAMHSASPSIPPRHDDDGEAPLWRKALPVVLILVVMGLVGYGLSTLMGSGGSSAPKKQTVKIAVLPDTPPPPPPPKEEKKPEPPKDDPKPMQMDQPKVADNPPPQPAEQLKMEGAAGDGPSAFASGSVAQDYAGQAIGNGGTQPKVVDRTKFKYYANSARQVLRAELDKTLPPEMLNLGARLRIWVDDRGAISRFEVAGLSDKAAEDKLRQAMDTVSRNYRLVPPPEMPQPLELRLSVNPVNG